MEEIVLDKDIKIILKRMEDVENFRHEQFVKLSKMTDQQQLEYSKEKYNYLIKEAKRLNLTVYSGGNSDAE